MVYSWPFIGFNPLPISLPIQIVSNVWLDFFFFLGIKIFIIVEYRCEFESRYFCSHESLSLSLSPLSHLWKIFRRYVEWFGKNYIFVSSFCKNAIRTRSSYETCTKRIRFTESLLLGNVIARAKGELNFTGIFYKISFGTVKIVFLIAMWYVYMVQK